MFTSSWLIYGNSYLPDVKEQTNKKSATPEFSLLPASKLSSDHGNLVTASQQLLSLDMGEQTGEAVCEAELSTTPPPFYTSPHPADGNDQNIQSRPVTFPTPHIPLTNMPSNLSSLTSSYNLLHTGTTTTEALSHKESETEQKSGKNHR